MIEAMKRRERERMLEEINSLMTTEREALLRAEKEKLQREVADVIQFELILAENQKKIEVILLWHVSNSQSLLQCYRTTARHSNGENLRNGSVWTLRVLKRLKIDKKKM